MEIELAIGVALALLRPRLRAPLASLALALLACAAVAAWVALVTILQP